MRILVFFLSISILGSVYSQSNSIDEQTVLDSIYSTYQKAHANLNSRSISKEYKEKLNIYLSKLNKTSDSYQQMKFLISEFDMQYYQGFKSSLKNDDNVLLLKLDLGASIINKDEKNGLDQFEKLKSLGEYTDDDLTFYRHVLKSSPHKGYLFTHSFEDTYCVWYLQHKYNVRSDVKLISLELLSSSKYRSTIDIRMDYNDQVNSSLVNSILAKNSNNQFAFSNTIPNSYFNADPKKLFIVGLVFVYADLDYNYFENEDLLKEFKPFLNKLIKSRSSSVLNYAPMVKVLLKVSIDQEDNVKTIELESLYGRMNKVFN